MSTLTPQAQALLTKFAQHPDVTPDQAANLEAAINSSPALIEQINKAVADDHLKIIVPLPAGKHAGGEYVAASETVRLALPMLAATANKPFNPAEVAFVLGHEVQHGFEHAAVAKAYSHFHVEAKQEATEKAAIHDYTTVIANPIAANRRDEAAAEIAGWNAMLDQIKSANENPTLADIYEKNKFRMADFIDRSGNNSSEYAYVLKPNLTLNPDLSLSPTHANIEAMGQNYFDKVPKKTNIGDLGKSDYVTYYGTALVEHAIHYENKHAKPYQGVMPRMTMDMAMLGLSEKLLEEEGINLSTPNKTQQPYYDSSLTPAALHHFDHTQSGPNNHQHVPIAPMQSSQHENAIAQGQEYRFFPHTPEDAYLDAYLDAAERNDYSARRTLTEQYEQLPHVHDLQQAAREALEAERLQALQEQLRQEQERQRQMQQEQEHSRGRGFSR